MNRIVIALVFVCVIAGRPVKGQQKPQYTQYIFNNFILNPAISGIENYTDVKAGYRNQWQGLENAPVTSYISIHAPLGKKFLYSNANSFADDGENPMSRSYLQNYMASEPHHGIGFHLVSDKAGPISTTDINLTYAYHQGITAKMNLAVGIAAGVSIVRLDASKVVLENSSDPALTTSKTSKTEPDLGLGLWLYGPQYFAGISVQQLLPNSISFTDIPEYIQGKQVPHLFLTGGYKFYLSEDIAAIPSVMVKFVSPSPASVDLNTKVAFKDKFWIGSSYRKDDSFSALAGFNAGSLVNVSYSYDFTVSHLRSVNEGSHEIILGLLLNNRYKVICPQKSW
jgi:type IX secretion system PorP/SprF family membrane protein